MAKQGCGAGERTVVVTQRVPIQERPIVTMVLQAAVCALLGFVLAGASLLDGQAPLAVALAGASGCGISGVAALVGASLGYAVFHGLSQGIEYIAAGVMIYTAGFVCQYLPFYRSRIFMPMVVTVIFGVTMAFGTVSEVRTELPFQLRLALEIGLSGVFTWLYAGALEALVQPVGQWGNGGVFCVGALGISVLWAMSGVLMFGSVSLGRVLACGAVMVAAYCGGGAIGTCVAAGCGAAMDMIVYGPGAFTLVYTLAALGGGMVRSRGRVLFAVVYLLCVCGGVVRLWSDGDPMPVVYECAAGAVCFLLLPGSWLRRLRGLIETTPTGEGEIRMRRYLGDRVRDMTKAFGALSELVQTELTTESPEPPLGEIFDRAAEAVCDRCARKSVCWTNHYLDMLVILGETEPILERRGRLQAGDLPGYFCDFCPNYDRLILAINYELRRRADSRLSRMNEREYIQTAAGQFDSVSRLLGELSQSLSVRPGADADREQRLLRCLRSLDLDCEVGVFRDRTGRLRITLRGKDLHRLTAMPDYLDRLSEALGMRLCRPGNGKQPRSILLLEAEPYAVTVGVASCKKRGEAVSGDRGRYFKTDGGVLYVLLSDGLGTGDNAAEQSSIVVDILEQLLRSGISPELSMKLVDGAMLLKNRETWGCATVDLLAVDLFTGRASFYKYGAAPSYVYSAQGLQRIDGDSLSVGMMTGEGQQPDMVTVQLQPGNVVLVASDGVTVEDDRYLLRQILTDRDSMKNLARSVLLTARNADPFGDDMTVLAVSFEERSS